MFARHSTEHKHHVQFMGRLKHTSLLTVGGCVNDTLLSITPRACERIEDILVAKL